MPEFLLEILSEDMPARIQVRAAEELKRLLTEELVQTGVPFDSAVAHSTPRRLALVIYGLPQKSPHRVEERKGPKVGAPDGAIQGFLKSAGLRSIDEAEIRDTDKGRIYFAVREFSAEPIAEILYSKLYYRVFPFLNWSKSMKWGRGEFEWVRPIRDICMVLDGASLNVEIDGQNVSSFDFGDDANFPFKTSTVGHRFLGSRPFEITNFADYERQLLDHHVVLDREKRKWRILGDAKRKAEELGLRLVLDEPLLEEVVGLVEWPVILVGAIDDPFMSLPPEVRRTTMRANQKYFTLEYPDGKPAPRFVIVSNMEAADGGAEIVAGNERVLRARLSDARFFYDQDLKVKLADQRPKLAKIAFHAKLGSLLDRVERLEKLAVEIARQAQMPDDTALQAIEAARLSKCDLVSLMVGEFPELQGIMGSYYALAQGATDEIADAIRDHYKPLGPSDACPTAPVSVALALAEKIDTLVGFFAIGETPTGSKDPFALRRAALGAIRLIVENGLRLKLNPIFQSAHHLSVYQITQQTIDKLKLDAQAKEITRFEFVQSRDVDQTDLVGYLQKEIMGSPAVRELIPIADEGFAKLLPFFADRLKVALRERGVRHDLVDAVFALGGEDDLVRLLARVQALQDFLTTDDGGNLLTAYRRAANILRIEEKRDGATYDGAPEPGLFDRDEERTLADALEAAALAVDPLIATEDFKGAMAEYAKLRPTVDAFFDHVTVNADDPAIRVNRLRLLSRIRSTLNKIADFSRIA